MSDGTDTYELTGVTEVTANQWHHVAVVVDRDDASNSTLYLDGIDDGPTKTGALTDVNSLNNSDNFYIGCHGGVSCSYDAFGYSATTPSKIDDVRIFDYPRTQAQIAWEYNQGKPIGHWRLDECSGTTANDSSGNGNSGTITIGATGDNAEAGTCTSGDSTDSWYNGASGKRNASLDFDGTDDYVEITDTSDEYDIDNDLTYSAWFKTKDSGNDKAIISRGTDNDWQYAMFKNASNQFWCKIYTQNDGYAYLETQVTSTVNDGNWHHGACSVSGTTLYGYIDGKLVGTDNTPSGTRDTSSAGELYIGQFDYTSNQYEFNGQIDDVRVYNYSLTEQQIKTLYNQGSVRFGE